MSSEQAIQTKIIKNLEQNHNAYVVNGIFSKSGIPDLVIGLPITKDQAMKHFEQNELLSIFLGIEVKKPETQTNTSKLQEYHLGAIQSKGGLSLVAWDSQMVDNYLEEQLC